MSTAVIIVAAGRGSRMGGDLPKQWQVLAGKPVLAHTVAAFAGMQVLVVIHPDDRALAEALGVPLVMGGATRDASVLAGLRALEGSGVTRVLIHDGARPLVSRALVDRLVAALTTHDGAAPALAALSPGQWTGRAFIARKRRRPFAFSRFSRHIWRIRAGLWTMCRSRGMRGLTWPSSRATTAI